MSKALTPEISQRVSTIIADACDPHLSLRDAALGGVYVHPVRDKAVHMCLPLADAMVRGLVRLPDLSRVDVEDLLQSARLGIVEGVDSFEPSRGNQIQTHLWMRMRWRINEERSIGHWRIMRPPNRMVAKYMGGQMSEEEAEAYLYKFVMPVGDH